MTFRLPENAFADTCPLWNSRVFILIAWLSAWPSACWANHVWTLKSPTARLAVKVEYNDGIKYSVSLRGKEVIAPSAIDLKVAGKGWLARQSSDPTATERSESETVEFVVPRKYRQLKTKYNELELKFANG